MRVTISKSNPAGNVSIPTSKSLTLRALFCAALARGESQIQHPLVCDDTNYAAAALVKLGVTIEDIEGVWHVTGGKFKIPSDEVNCGESATTLRLLTGLVSLLPGTITLTGGPSLIQRPIRTLVDALRFLGIRGSVTGLMNPPVTIHGGTFTGGVTEVAGNISSQYITSLMLIGSFAPVETIIRLTTPLTSRPYILMTLQVMRKFGISVKRQGNNFIIKRQRYVPTTINIEADWSSASYFLALGTLSEEGVTLDNMSTSSRQGDRILLEHLRAMGANVQVMGNIITVKKGDDLKAIHTDVSDCIDLLPTLAVLAALAKGESEFRGIQPARLKESNRVKAIREGLTKLGVQVGEFREYMTIKGMVTEKKNDDDSGTSETMLENPEEFYADGKEKPAVVIDSYNDHRIAMAFAVMGAALGGISITHAECVSKTFPDFWKYFKNVGGEYTVDEQ